MMKGNGGERKAPLSRGGFYHGSGVQWDRRTQPGVMGWEGVWHIPSPTIVAGPVDGHPRVPRSWQQVMGLHSRFEVHKVHCF